MTPSYDDIAELPTMLVGTVPNRSLGDGGHLRHYLDYGDTGADVICRQVGIDDPYRAVRRMGVFTAEHHLRYHADMDDGARFTAHTLLLDRSAKAGHLVSFILDRTTHQLSCSIEILLVHVHLDTRRPVEFPTDVATGLDEWVARARAVPWPVPRSGGMGIRR